MNLWYIPLDLAAKKLARYYRRLGIQFGADTIASSETVYFANAILDRADIQATCIIKGKRVETWLRAPVRGLSYSEDYDRPKVASGALVETDGGPYAVPPAYENPKVGRIGLWWAIVKLNQTLRLAGEWPSKKKFPSSRIAIWLNTFPLLVAIWRDRQLLVNQRPDNRIHPGRDAAGEWPDNAEMVLSEKYGLGVSVPGSPLLQRKGKKKKRTPGVIPVIHTADLIEEWLAGVKPPKGLVYEVKRWSVYGVEDQEYIRRLEKEGAWRKVPKRRHPKVLSDSKKWIIRHGCILMQVPTRIHYKMKLDDLKIAQGPVDGVMAANKSFRNY